MERIGVNGRGRLGCHRSHPFCVSKGEFADKSAALAIDRRKLAKMVDETEKPRHTVAWP